MINLDHLNVISTICETGSFQQASERLNKVRSAVSYSVKQVEDLYQIQIFDRSKYRPELTPEGKILLTKIRHLLQQTKEFEAFVHELKGEQETEIKLSISSIFPIRWLTGLLASLRSHFPTTTLHLQQEIASGERALLAGNVDLALYAAPTRDVAIDYKQIDRMKVPLLIHRDLITANPEKVTRENLTQHPQVVVKSSDEQSPDTGLLSEAHKWYVSDLQAKKDLICAGLGWGRLPDHLARAELASGQLISLPTLGEITLPICIAKRANSQIGPVGTHIWAFFEDRQINKDQDKSTS